MTGAAIAVVIAVAAGAWFVLTRSGGRQPTGAFRNRPTGDEGTPLITNGDVPDDDESGGSGDSSR